MKLILASAVLLFACRADAAYIDSLRGKAELKTSNGCWRLQ